MANSLTTIQIAAVYSLINNGTLAKIEKGSDRYSVIKALRVLKPYAEEYEGCRVDALKKLREGHDEECLILDRMNRRDETLTKDEIEKGNKFAKELSSGLDDCLRDLAMKEHELDFEPLSEETFMGLLEGNNWHTSDCMFLEEILCNN